MKIPTRIRDLTKEPQWREKLRDEIEKILNQKEKITNQDLLTIIDKIYSLFVLEFHHFTVDHCEFRKTILELQNQGLPPIK